MCLEQSVFSDKEFFITPIRYQDKEPIRQWRNDQIDVLRQGHLLSEDEQTTYFSTTVQSLFNEEQPDQILTSFFKNEELIGYGGLVHIDWKSKHAEISFLLKTKFNSEESYLEKFEIYLGLIEKMALEAGLHKIHTYGYNLADYRFEPIKKQGFELEARLVKHKMVDNKLVDVLIYGKLL